MRRSLRRGFVLAALGLLVRAGALGQKTDVLTLRGGDRITGEIRSYGQGRLTVDSAAAGWIRVKWNAIVSIQSDETFDVETVDGVHHYGRLAPSDPPGRLRIVSGAVPVTVAFFEVVTLAPVRQTFWRRWDGSLDLGFHYAQASHLTQVHLDADGTYRMRRDQVSAAFSSFLSRQNGQTAADRAEVEIRYDRFLEDRWLLEVGLGFDRNVELGLAARGSFGAAVGRNLIQTHQAQGMAYVGILANRETPVEGASGYNAEATVGARYAYFMYEAPKVTVSASLQLFPGLTDVGRVRLEADVSVRREIVSDFTLSISVFDSFDSRDPTTLQSRNDWGPAVSIGWRF